MKETKKTETTQVQLGNVLNKATKLKNDIIEKSKNVIGNVNEHLILAIDENESGI